MDADLTLFDLDADLRRTWLECCGHMSDFRFRRTRYVKCGQEMLLPVVDSPRVGVCCCTG